MEAISQHVYTPAYVAKLVELLSTEEGYKATVGTVPRRNVTTLPKGKKVKVTNGAEESAQRAASLRTVCRTVTSSAFAP